jgi:DnaJ family protein C protein 13
MDHARPTLIWNNKTRDELRETIENEIRNFNIDKDLGHGHLISWNHNELKSEVFIYVYYLNKEN